MCGCYLDCLFNLNTKITLTVSQSVCTCKRNVFLRERKRDCFFSPPMFCPILFCLVFLHKFLLCFSFFQGLDQTLTFVELKKRIKKKRTILPWRFLILTLSEKLRNTKIVNFYCCQNYLKYSCIVRHMYIFCSRQKYV